ncbi:adenosylcobinamide amidohydrolase [Daeguia caeni]|uniref:Adenosylcobinamide amidohydrolase n=1 Tax=Daeguia caeni TaxID=439612 RepID=A0ABV9H7P9_9HYPH
MTETKFPEENASSLASNFKICCNRPWLVAEFASPHQMVSWSLNRPGFTTAERVAWLEVGNDELITVTDPKTWFQHRLLAVDLGDAVGLITARNVACYEIASATVDDVQADCLITLGLNNGETVGKRQDPMLHVLHAGTINILAAVSVPLTDAALLEMSSIVAQARTTALLRFGYRRPCMDDIVTGTGTDCIVTAAPCSSRPQAYAGMHTAIGEAVGRSVLEATTAAAIAWFNDWCQPNTALSR